MAIQHRHDRGLGRVGCGRLRQRLDAEPGRQQQSHDTIAALNDPDGGTGENLVFLLAADDVSAAEAHGFVDDIRLSSIARNTINDSYEAGAKAGGGGEATVARTNPTLVRSSP